MDIYSQRMRDRRMRSETELAREFQLSDWSRAGNLSNRSSGVQIPRNIYTRLKRYLYSAKCSWIIIILNYYLVRSVSGQDELCPNPRWRHLVPSGLRAVFRERKVFFFHIRSSLYTSTQILTAHANSHASMRICVCSKDAQKQLARTSLIMPGTRCVTMVILCIFTRNNMT